MHDPRTILITGGSSGIGAALARHYAKPGRRILITGRDLGRLSAIVEAVRATDAEAQGVRMDVTDRAAMDRWIREIDAVQPIDLVIANAGISAGTGGGGETAEQARRIFAVNLDGVLNTVEPVIERMTGRGSGQIAIMSSLAAFRGFPGAPAYSASKAAVKTYGEALRGTLAPKGVRVCVLCPGFVKSAMTDANDFPMPLLMSAERAAKIIARGLARDRARIAFPFPMAFAAWLAGTLPPAAVDLVLSRLPEKASH